MGRGTRHAQISAEELRAAVRGRSAAGTAPAWLDGLATCDDDTLQATWDRVDKGRRMYPSEKVYERINAAVDDRSPEAIADAIAAADRYCGWLYGRYPTPLVWQEETDPGVSARYARLVRRVTLDAIRRAREGQPLHDDQHWGQTPSAVMRACAETLFTSKTALRRVAEPYLARARARDR